jgi:formyltetrahydrofolate deformylase
MNYPENTAILLAHCSDSKGILHTVTDFILSNNGNITKLDEHVDDDEHHFFMRVQFDINEFAIPREKISEYFDTLVGQKYQMKWSLHFSGHVPRVAIFVSKYPHCIYDLLSRYESGEWNIDIPLIIGNHEKFKPLAEKFGIPFHYIPITKATKAAQEDREIELIKSHDIDLIVLARYMQILSAKMTDTFPQGIINIHHSSLPAFAGANPYKAAFVRGVKFMGATAHYVTEDLDEGPIIAQDVYPISHRDSIADLKRKGRDIEKIVLAKAIYAHLNHQVLTYKNRTVIFG